MALIPPLIALHFSLLVVAIVKLTARPAPGDDPSDDGDDGGRPRNPPRTPRPPGPTEPAWWPEFERAFATYVLADSAKRRISSARELMPSLR
jgi:hypothetical protein